MFGSMTYDNFGASVAVGDVNGDGVGDLVVGAPAADPYNRVSAGTVFTIFGQSGTSRPDLDMNVTLAAATGFKVSICSYEYY